jgi:hypothetical protein
LRIKKKTAIKSIQLLVYPTARFAGRGMVFFPNLLLRFPTKPHIHKCAPSFPKASTIATDALGHFPMATPSTRQFQDKLFSPRANVNNIHRQ